MFHLTPCLFLLLFTEFGFSQQDINVASFRNEGACSSSVTTAVCNKLIDDTLVGGVANRWATSYSIIGQWILFEFNDLYQITRIVIFHPEWNYDRNIKEVQLTFSDGYSIQFELKNNNTGLRETDFIHNISTTSNYMNMSITKEYDDTGNAYNAWLEVQIYGIPIPTTTSVSVPLTSAILSTTNAPTTNASIVSTLQETTQISSTETDISETNLPTTTIRQTSPFTDSSTTKIFATTTSVTLSTLSYAPTIKVKESTINLPVSTSMMETTLDAKYSDTQFDPDAGDTSVYIIVGVVMAILVIAVVLVVVGLVFVRRRRKKNMDTQPADGNLYVNMKTIDQAPKSEPELMSRFPIRGPPTDGKISDSSVETSPETSVQDLKLVDGEPEYTDTEQLPVFSNAIAVDDLATTVDGMLQKSAKFQEEFKNIPAGKQHPTTFADRSTLHIKNRFRNIKPYDHSRVSLIQKESDDSMYINANFISAYNQPKYYIAAQGPNKDSVDDFWRMIWEHRVTVIVMVTNCKEAGKDKCIKYWPNQEDSKQTYADMDVVFDKNNIAADYKIRDFKISKAGETRDVRQYHYTSWPDEGVPTSCSALISFVNRIREFTDDKEPPIVVHCSAGVGRTGTFIAVNYSVDMAREEKIVDIKKVVHRLREDRINMVQTLSQYKFLYALMLECLYCGEVTIPCQGASEKIQQIFIKTDGKDSQTEQQWRVLQVFKPKNFEDECLAGKHKDNIEKNRTQDIVPHDNHRPYLRRRPDYTSNYINAVFVDGYKKKNKFMLTQHPLENTVVDLWRTVSDFNISTIVMLNGCGEDAETYWPEAEYSETLKYGDFLEVTFKRVDKQDDFIITELQIFEEKEKANVVTHIQVKTWSEDSKPKLSILPALYNIVTQTQMTDEDSRIMIHNLNGDGNTGVYCALHQIFDKIKEEQEVDIFNAVKNTRMSRPDAIPDMDTYRYLHDASVQFIEQFSTYANLQ